ncbi:hypothetical protein AAG906_038022 [Vitis piasezkii]
MNQKTWNKYILPEDDILIDYAMGLYLRPFFEMLSTFVVGEFTFDSLKSINKPNRLKTLVTPIAMLLPRILRATKYYGENGDPKGEHAWDIERLNNIPQQTKDGDCGIFFFLIKFAEDLMYNHPMDTLIGERMDWFHEKMAVKLFFHKELPM